MNTALGLPPAVISSVSFYAIGAFTVPLFFFVSGLFMQSSLELGWKSYAIKRLIPLFYLYVLWSVIQWGSRLAMGGQTNNKIAPDAILYILWEPVNTVWFIYALLIFTVLLKALRHVPLIYLGVVSGLLFVLDLSDVSVILDRVCRYFPYFLAGHFARDVNLSLFNSLSRKRVYGIALLALFSGVSYLSLQQGLTRPPALEMATAVLGIVATVWLMMQIQLTKLGQALAFIGQRSIGIFLVHFLPAAGTRIVLTKLGVASAVEAGPYLVLMLAWLAGVFVPLALYVFTERTGRMTWLFAPPRKLVA